MANDIIPPTRRQIEYVLFDMDGLMLDSERIYTRVTNQILAPYGAEMTWDIKAGLMGKPERAAAEHLLSFFPGISLTIESYLTERTIIQDQLWPTVPLLPGVRKLVTHLKSHNIQIAVATGSKRRNFELKTVNHQDVFGLFEGKVVCGDDAASDLPGGGNGKEFVIRGKPEPDVFLVAARELLGRDVGEPQGEVNEKQTEERAKGLVFEDSLPGMQAGRRAGMHVVWVPDSSLLDVEYNGEERADQLLKSLEEFRPEEWGLPPYSD
ncbi:HAD-like protein [Pluteus cervinus]|uniref:HAD-like protein n=1 Tax=Pluteus cervinus TaxID=181527 RepID=A0ACD3AYJ8_9AGAR|nr:HAD-like protein [Pluteus cervinus]